MSLFTNAFDEDPFFRGTGFPPSMFGRDPFQDMFGGQRQRQLMRGGALTDGRGVGQVPRARGMEPPSHNQLAVRDPFQSMMFPFGGMNPFQSMFQNMERMMATAANDPNAHTFSSSSVMHYSSNGGEGGQPTVYHASSSTRQAPGGIKETRKTVHDSESGVRKMAIGHHIGDRSHVIEKRHNVKSQCREEHQEFVNIDEDEAGSFNREWTEKTGSMNSRYHPSLQAGRRHAAQAMQRGLPAAAASSSSAATPATTQRHSHTGEKRKHRPPSLIHDNSDDDEVTVVDPLHHPTAPGGPSFSSSSFSRARATPYERRRDIDGGGHHAQSHLHEGERSAGHHRVVHHHQRESKRSHNILGRLSDGSQTSMAAAVTARGRGQQPKPIYVVPETYQLNSRSRELGDLEGVYSTGHGESCQHHHHHHSNRSHPYPAHVDPGTASLHEHEAKSNKRHKQRGVHFQ